MRAEVDVRLRDVALEVRQPGQRPGGHAGLPGPHSGTITGTIVPADVIGPAGQGIKPGEYAELLREIRAQLNEHRGRH